MGLRGPKPGAGQKRGGRRKGTKNKIPSDIRAAYREHTMEAKDCILEIMRTDPDSKCRLDAAKEINNRALGKSVAQTNIAGWDGGPLTADILNNMAPDDLDALVVKLAAIAGVDPPPREGQG
jgi:hypothetical protein